MATTFDVAARLGAGRPAVEHTQTYVWACHLLGYHHPELTACSSQVRDWYDSEEGLDLHVLDGDCTHLWSAAHLVGEALRTQLAQIAALAEAGMGPGAAAATHFLQRHGAAAHAVVAGIRAAAEGCQVLRDQLWELVERKATAVVAIDDRRLGERPAWLPAAQAVAAGVDGGLAAEDLIRQQVAPYVDHDIRGDWLATMRMTKAAVAASYDRLIEQLTAAAPARFEVPEKLGSSIPASCRPAELSIPAAVLPGAGPPVTSQVWGSGLDEGIGLPAAATPPGVGGLGGLVGRIIETMGELLSSPSEQLADQPHPAPSAAVDDEAARPGQDAIAQPAASQLSATTPDRTPASGPVAGLAVAPQVVPVPSAESVDQQPEEKTPCELAADELPQAGQ